MFCSVYCRGQTWGGGGIREGDQGGIREGEGELLATALSGELYYLSMDLKGEWNGVYAYNCTTHCYSETV